MRRAHQELLWIVSVFAVLAGPASAPTMAQMRYHTRHHHHDAAGHRIDDAGHHIDLHGRHTGNWGVFDNGRYEYAGPTSRAGSVANSAGGYWSNGVYYQYQTAAPPVGGGPAAPTTQPAAQPSAAGKTPRNSVPGANRPSAARGKIILNNPADSGGDIHYLLNGKEFSMPPGYSQTLESDRVWTIEFDRGGERGDVRYTLRPGTFGFVVRNDEWTFAEKRVEEKSAEAVESEQGPVPMPVP